MSKITKAPVPAGMVGFFNLATCPTGWSEVTDARGRNIVGLPSGGTLAGTTGTALSDQENRAVGQHTHTFTGSALGTHSHTVTENVFKVPGAANTFTSVFPSGTAATNSAIVTDAVSAGTPAGTNANTGSVAGTNAPYIQFVCCEKD